MTGRVKKRVALLVGAVFLLTAGVGSAYLVNQARTRSRMAEWLRNGMTAYKAGDYQTTMDNLGKYAGRDRTNEEVIMALADSLRHLPTGDGKNVAEAIRYARFAVSLNPTDLAPKEMLLSLYEQAGFVSELMQVADSILAIQKDHSAALEAKAEALTRMGKFDGSGGALETAQSLAATHPEEVRGHVAVIEVMARMGASPAEILAYTDSVADKYPDDPNFLILKAQVHAGSQDAPVAVDLAKKAALMPVKSAREVAERLSLLDILAAGHAELAALADKLLEREMKGPFAPQVATVAAERSWKLGRLDQARAHAAKAVDTAKLSAAPDAALGWWSFLGISGGQDVDQPDIARVLSELADRPGTEAKFWINLDQGMSDLNAGRLNEAEQKFVKAEAYGQNMDITQFFRGDIKQRLGEWGSAKSLWGALAKGQPSWRVVHASLVVLMLQHDQLDDALDYAENSLSARPDFPELVTLMRALSALAESGRATPEQLLRAMTVADTVEQLSKSDPNIQTLIARINLAGGKPDKGIELAKSVLAATPPAAQDSLLALAAALRPIDAPLADRAFSMARAAGENPDIVFQSACLLAGAGKVEEGRKLLEQGVDAHKDAERLAYELRLAAYLDRVNDPGAAAAFAKLAASHATDPALQLALLDSRAAWTDETIVSAAIARLRALSADGVAWKINEGRRLLTFDPTPERAGEAATHLAEAVHQEPGNVSAMALAAEAYIMLQKRSEAIGMLAKIIDADPDRAASCYPRLIELLQLTGSSEDANRRLQAYVKLTGLAPDAQRQRAKLLASQGLWDLAAADFRQLAASGSIEDAFSLGVALSHQGDRDGARRQLETVLKSPTLPEPVVIAIADFYASRGDIDLGRDTLDQRLPQESAPRRAGILAAYLERVGRFPQAEQQYVEQSKDGKPESLAELAKFYFKRGRVDEARATADRGLAMAPTNPELKRISGFIKLSQGSSVDAMKDIAASLDSLDDSSPLKRLSVILQDLAKNPSDTTGYIKKLEALTKSDPTFFAAWRLLVEARFQRGEAKEGLDAARLAVRQSPADPRPAQLATAALIAAGKFDEAMVMAQQWRQRSISQPFEPDLSIASILGAQQHYDDALKRIEPWRDRIIAEADTAPDHLVEFAELLVRAGRVADAQALLWSRAESDPKWALRSVSIIGALTGPAQEEWIAKLQPMVDKTPQGRFALGCIFYDIAIKAPSKQQFERVVEMLKGAIDDPANRAQAALRMASSYQTLGNKPEAIRLYRIVVDLMPNEPTPLNNLADLLSQDAATSPEAATMAQKAVDLAAARGDAAALQTSFTDTLGVALIKCGRYQEAEVVIRKGMALDPNSLSLNVGLAEATIAQDNNLDQARQMLRMADSRRSGAATDRDLEARIAVVRRKVEASK